MFIFKCLISPGSCDMMRYSAQHNSAMCNTSKKDLCMYEAFVITESLLGVWTSICTNTAASRSHPFLPLGVPFLRANASKATGQRRIILANFHSIQSSYKAKLHTTRRRKLSRQTDRDLQRKLPFLLVLAFAYEDKYMHKWDLIQKLCTETIWMIPACKKR